MFLAIDSVFGLPAHPLFVHAAVLLVPLAALALAATGWRASWRHAYLYPVVALALVGGLFAFLAAQTGEPLEDAVRRAAAVRVGFGEHPEQGDRAEFASIVFAACTVAYFIVVQWGKQLSLPSRAPVIAYAVVLLPAAFAVLTIAIAGHSGAALVWRDVGSFAAGAKG